jgi:hypothetical protein
MMNIALDFDDTFTRDPDFWLKFVLLCRQSGHQIYCVTARDQNGSQEVYDELGQFIGKENCFFTNMSAKKSFMWRKGISIDVWIDDNPWYILNGVEANVETSGITK